MVMMMMNNGDDGDIGGIDGGGGGDDGDIGGSDGGGGWW